MRHRHRRLHRKLNMPSATTNLRIRPATQNDLQGLRLLYNDIIDAMDASQWHAQWRKDGYPSNAELENAILKGELYVAILSDSIVAAMILNHAFNEGYRTVPWQITCNDEELLCIHTLGVSPHIQRCGIASAMLGYAVQRARAMGCRCIRLDVIENNRPADLLYTRYGFNFCGTHHLHYDSVSAAFNMYEYLL